MNSRDALPNTRFKLPTRFVVAISGGFAAVLLFAGCSGSADPSVSMLRIHNEGTAQLLDLEVEFPDTALSFGSVAVGATTDYQLAPGGVYAQAAFRFTEQGESDAQPVDDWVDEIPLKGRRFTYNLQLVMTAEGPGIGMRIVKDQ